jgi:hypothetical protein
VHTERHGKVYARYYEKRSKVEYMVDIAERVKNVAGTQRIRDKYWHGIREDVKESKVDRVEDGLMN